MAPLPTRKQAKKAARGMMDHYEPHQESGPDMPEMDDDTPMPGGRAPGMAGGTPMKRAPGAGKGMPKRAPGRKK